jgi:hypothetical protein
MFNLVWRAQNIKRPETKPSVLCAAAFVFYAFFASHDTFQKDSLTSCRVVSCMSESEQSKGRDTCTVTNESNAR